LTEKKVWPVSLISSLIIAFSLLALAFLPGLLQQRHFSFELLNLDSSTKDSFPLELSFPTIQPKGFSKARTLREIIGKNPNGILICFWATWCPPCLDELPGLEYLNRELKGHEGSLPSLVTISVDESPEDVTALYKTLDFKPSFLVMHDKQGVLARKVGTTKFPETYWVKPDGNILHKWIGPQNWLSQDVALQLKSLAKK
jgi:thiol-disulfide isomerase/thioredoxin